MNNNSVRIGKNLREDNMTTITIETPDAISMSHEHHKAVMLGTHVVNEMSRWFGADVKAAVSLEQNHEGEHQKIISFSFSGSRAAQAWENVASFLYNNTDIGSAYIEPSKVDELKKAPIKMDLDKLSKYKTAVFDAAAHDAGHNGSIVSRHLSNKQSSGPLMF